MDLTNGFRQASGLSVALGGFLVLVGIAYATIFIMMIFGTISADILRIDQNHLMLTFLLVIGVLDIIAGIRLRRDD